MLAALLAGAITQGVAARRAANAARQQRKMLQDEAGQNNANYLQGLHETAVDGPMAQAQLAQVRRQTERLNTSAQNAAIMGGLTREQQLAGNLQTAQNIADVVDRLTARQENARLQLRQQHQQQTAAVNAANRRLKQDEARNWSLLGNNLAKALTVALAQRR